MNVIKGLYFCAGAPCALALYFLGEPIIARNYMVWTNGGLLFLVILSCLMRPQFRPVVSYSHITIGVFFSVLLVCTTIAIAYVSHDILFAQFRALVGLFLWCSVFFLVYHSTQSLAEIKTLHAVLETTGLFIGLSVYVSYFFAHVRLPLGEVQVSSEGMIRAFGPLGDQVGFVLSLFIFWAILKGSWLRFAFHSGALLLTGTRGAMFAVFVGLPFCLYRRAFTRGRIGLRALGISSALVILVLTGLLLSPAGDFIVVRMTGPEFLESGILTRAGSMQLGIEVFLSHAWTGVGFNGFAAQVWNYSPALTFDEVIANYVALTTNQIIQTATDGGIVGVMAFLAMMALFIRSHARAIRRHAEGASIDFMCFQIWTLAMLFGNQTAVWLINNSLIAYYLFLLAGLSESYLRMTSRTPV